jgi:hypothetical protein
VERAWLTGNAVSGNGFRTRERDSNDAILGEAGGCRTSPVRRSPSCWPRSRAQRRSGARPGHDAGDASARRGFCAGLQPHRLGCAGEQPSLLAHAPAAQPRHQANLVAASSEKRPTCTTANDRYVGFAERGGFDSSALAGTRALWGYVEGGGDWPSLLATASPGSREIFSKTRPCSDQRGHHHYVGGAMPRQAGTRASASSCCDRL